MFSTTAKQVRIKIAFENNGRNNSRKKRRAIRENVLMALTKGERHLLPSPTIAVREAVYLVETILSKVRDTNKEKKKKESPLIVRKPTGRPLLLCVLLCLSYSFRPLKG